MKRIFLFILKLIKILWPIVLFLAIILFIIKFLNREISYIILEYIKVLVYPLVIIYLTIIFKHNISKFIDELSELSIFGNKAKREQPAIQQKTPEKNIPNESKESIDLKENKVNKEKEINHNITNEELKNQNKTLALQITKLQSALSFERIYQNIFGSQIKLLEDLRKFKSTEVATYKDIAAYYQGVREKWINLNSYSLENYLLYLENSGLVEKDINKSYKITILGIDFLEYIESMKYLKEKNN